jgi:hypothetical protein
LLAAQQGEKSTYVPYFPPISPGAHDATFSTQTIRGRQAVAFAAGVIIAIVLFSVGVGDDKVVLHAGTVKVGIAVMPVAHSTHLLLLD